MLDDVQPRYWLAWFTVSLITVGWVGAFLVLSQRQHVPDNTRTVRLIPYVSPPLGASGVQVKFVVPHGWVKEVLPAKMVGRQCYVVNVLPWAYASGDGLSLIWNDSATPQAAGFSKATRWWYSRAGVVNGRGSWSLLYWRRHRRDFDATYGAIADSVVVVQ